jgi:hypothetical protein
MTDRKKSRCTEEQSIGFLKLAQAGVPFKGLFQNSGFGSI